MVLSSWLIIRFDNERIKRRLTCWFHMIDPTKRRSETLCYYLLIYAPNVKQKQTIKQANSTYTVTAWPPKVYSMFVAPVKYRTIDVGALCPTSGTCNTTRSIQLHKLNTKVGESKHLPGHGLELRWSSTRQYKWS